MLDIGISLGSLLIIPTANSLADAVGWRGTYTTVGLATVAFACAWHLLAADAPSQCWCISAAELTLTLAPNTNPNPNPDSDPNPNPDPTPTPTPTPAPRYISAAELDYLQKYVGQQTKPKPAAAPAAAGSKAVVAAGEGGVWRVLGLPRHVALAPGKRARQKVSDWVSQAAAYGCRPCHTRLQALSHAVAGPVTRGCRPCRVRLQACGRSSSRTWPSTSVPTT